MTTPPFPASSLRSRISAASAGLRIRTAVLGSNDRVATGGNELARGTRYRLAVARKTRADTADAISRLADSSEEAVRDLVAFPLRVLIGTLDFLEAQLHKASDSLREIDPIDERVVQLERRVDSLEKRTTGRRKVQRTTAQATRRASGVEREPVDHSADRPQAEPGSAVDAGHSGA